MASTFSSEFLKVSEPIPNVYHIQLARKPVNAFTFAFWKAYGALFDRLSQRETDVRAIVLSSSIPKMFCAGIDLADLAGAAAPTGQEDPARSFFSGQELIREFQHAIGAPSRCPIPVIVAVHGLVLGLGIDIMCACDIRYAASNSTFCIKETEMGLAADIGTLAYLPKICGSMSLVKEYAYSSNPFGPDVAEKMGFISSVTQGGQQEVIVAALALARTIASRSPVAVAGTKKILGHAQEHTIAENLDLTAVWNGAALQSKDMPTIFAALKSKRSPVFSSLKKTDSKL